MDGWNRRTQLSVDILEVMSKRHLYYIANSKSELLDYGKERTTEEIYAILSDAQLCDDEEYEGEHDEMGIDDDLTELMARSYTGDDREQIPSQNLKILNTLDFDKDNFLSQDNGLRNEMDGDQDDLNKNWIKKMIFDPDQLAQEFVRNNQ